MVKHVVRPIFYGIFEKLKCWKSQCFQRLLAFSEILPSGTAINSRTLRATSCATPRHRFCFQKSTDGVFFIASTNASIITNTREKVNLFHTKTKNSFYFFFNLFRPNPTTDFPSWRKNLWIQTKNIHMPCHCLTQRSLLFCIMALFLIRVCFFKIT